MKKIYLYANSTTQKGVQKKIIKIFPFPFFPFATGVKDTGGKSLREFSKNLKRP